MATKSKSSKRSSRKRPAGKVAQYELGALSSLEIAARMDRIAKLIARAIGDVAREHGATPGQLHIVERLARAPGGLTAKQLAAALAIRPGSLTGMINALEDKGVLRRESVAGDARQQKIVLLEGAADLIALLEQVDALVDGRLGNPESETVEQLAATVKQLEKAARDHAHLPTPAALLRAPAAPAAAVADKTVTPITARLPTTPAPEAGSEVRTGTDHWRPTHAADDNWQGNQRRDEGSLGRGLFRIASRVLSAADSLGRGNG